MSRQAPVPVEAMLVLPNVPHMVQPAEPDQPPKKKQHVEVPCDCDRFQMQFGTFKWSTAEAVVMEYKVDAMIHLADPERHKLVQDRAQHEQEFLDMLKLIYTFGP